MTKVRKSAWAVAGILASLACDAPVGLKEEPDSPLPTECSDPRGRVHSGVIDTATWRAADGPHRVVTEVVPVSGSRVRLEITGRLVIEPGTLVCFDDDGAGLIVQEGASLIAQGTQELPVSFRYGQQPPTTFQWHILVRGHGTFSHAEFEGGFIRSVERFRDRPTLSGRLEARDVRMGPRSGIEAADADLRNVVMDSGCTAPCSYSPAISLRAGYVVDGLRVRHARNYGFVLWDSGTVSNCEVTGSRQAGIVVFSAGVRISNCNIHGNGDVGLWNSHDEPVDARGNWWGDPEGPFGPNGDGVMGNVIYEPWLSEPVTVPGSS